MKSVKAITLASTLVLGVFTSKAQEGTFEVSLNLAPIAFANYSINAGYNFADEMTVGAVIGYQNLKVGLGDGTSSEEVGYKGFYVAPEFRYYFDPSRTGNDGYFGGGYLKVRSMGTSGDVYSGYDENSNLVMYDVKNFGVAMGILGGRQWATKIGVTFSTWAGLGYYLFDNKTYTNNYNPDNDPNTFNLSSSLPSLDFRVGITVGYRF